MGKNRASLHRGKCGSAKHNEHSHLSEEERDTEILLPDYMQELRAGTDSLLDCEMKFYERYIPALALQNEKYKKKGNYDRIKDLKQFHDSKRYMPTEEILQYGNVLTPDSEMPDRETFIAMVDEYMNWKIQWAKDNGGHLKVLYYACHLDEVTFHAQGDEIWEYESDGVLNVGQEKAMELAGLELPDPSKPVGKNNNRNMTFTKMCREKWYEILEEHGFDVEREPLPDRKSKTIRAYKASQERSMKKRENELAARENELAARENELAVREGELDAFENDMALKEIELDERADAIKMELDKQEENFNKRDRIQKQKESALKVKEDLLNADIKAFENRKMKYRATLSEGKRISGISL